MYGDNRSLRVWLEQNDLHFVLAVRSNQYVWTQRMRQATVEQLGRAVTAQAWQNPVGGKRREGAPLVRLSAYPAAVMADARRTLAAAAAQPHRRQAGLLCVLCAGGNGLAHASAGGRHALDDRRVFRGSQGGSRAGPV